MIEKPVLKNVRIGIYEVSVADWIAYMAITSGCDTTTAFNIHLADYKNSISTKLPDLKIKCWSNYVIAAALKNEKESVGQKYYNPCRNNFFTICFPKTTWDTIKKYRLYDLPVVGITYEQALDFLAYKQQMLNNCWKGHFKEDKYKYRYECILPTPEQFDSIQQKLDSLNLEKCTLFNYKNSFCIDCPSGKKLKNHPVCNKQGAEPVYRDSYFPYYFGVYNLKGNVAEMTSIKGIAKGGSCQHYASDASVGRSQYYSNPEIWLGLRIWYRMIPK
jgi:formylglycine-generating enzyme required for sulfatase activity